LNERKVYTEAIKRAAYHEAGHAVVYHLKRFCVDIISISHCLDQGNAISGRCHLFDPVIGLIVSESFRVEQLQDDELANFKIAAEGLIFGLLAGPLAEKRISKSRTPLYSKGLIAHGGTDDLKAAVAVAGKFYSPDDAGVFIKLAEGEVTKLFRKRKIWNAVTTIAHELIDKQHLEGLELHHLFHGLP
jgi:hypothetical protein